MARPQVTSSAMLAFLRRPHAHPEGPSRVQVIETHYAWVFVGERVVRKLKKPIRAARVDFSNPVLRQAGCRAEVELNRALAPDIYLGVDTLTANDDGALALNGAGAVVDWLVRMRRLPAARTLDRARRVTSRELDALADTLAGFYADAPIAVGSAAARLAQVRAAIDGLTTSLAGFPGADATLAALREEATRAAGAIGARAEQGRVVDGHGDLRPEHVYVTRPPRVLDRIEFDPALRQVDWLADMALLAVDLEAVGRTSIADELVRATARRLGDAPPPSLALFYRAWRACLRARLCLEHRARPGRRPPAFWTRRAHQYLRIAERQTARFRRG